MSRLRTSLLAVAAATALAATSIATPAAAAPTAAKADRATAAALERIAAGTQSPADLALIRSQPKLAATTIDPSLTTVTMKVVENPAVPGARAARAAGRAAGRPQPNIAITTYCGNWVEITITAFTLLHFKFWQWTHHAGYCSDLDTIRRWDGRYDRIDYADPTITVADLVANDASATPTLAATSHMQRHLEQCVDVVLMKGCFHWYPWSRTTIYPDFTDDWSWGVG